MAALKIRCMSPKDSTDLPATFRMRDPGLRFKELAGELGGRLKVAKVNVDETQELAMQFRLSSIPAFVVFKGGQAVERAVGAMPKSAFKNLVSSHL